MRHLSAFALVLGAWLLPPALGHASQAQRADVASLIAASDVTADLSNQPCLFDRDWDTSKQAPPPILHEYLGATVETIPVSDQLALRDALNAGGMQGSAFCSGAETRAHSQLQRASGHSSQHISLSYPVFSADFSNAIFVTSVDTLGGLNDKSEKVPDLLAVYAFVMKRQNGSWKVQEVLRLSIT